MIANMEFFREIGGVVKIKYEAFFYEKTAISKDEKFIEVEERTEENEDEQ